MTQLADTTPARERSATTVTATYAFLAVVSAAWWLARDDAWLQVAAVSLPLVAMGVWLSRSAVAGLSPSLADARLSRLLWFSLVAVTGSLGVASTRYLLDALRGQKPGAQLIDGIAGGALDDQFQGVSGRRRAVIGGW